MTTEHQPWRAEALCGKLDEKGANRFFAKRDTLDEKAAMLTCRMCPVAIPCRDYAILYEEDGVWGGTRLSDRKSMLKVFPFLKTHLQDLARQGGQLEEHSLESFLPRLNRSAADVEEFPNSIEFLDDLAMLLDIDQNKKTPCLMTRQSCDHTTCKDVSEILGPDYQYIMQQPLDSEPSLDTEIAS